MSYCRLIVLAMPLLILAKGCMHERQVVAEIALRDAQMGEPIRDVDVTATWTRSSRWGFRLDASVVLIRCSSRTDAEGHVAFGPMPEGYWIIEFSPEPGSLFYTFPLRVRVDERLMRWEVVPPYDREGLRVDEGPAIETQVVDVQRRSAPCP